MAPPIKYLEANNIKSLTAQVDAWLSANPSWQLKNFYMPFPNKYVQTLCEISGKLRTDGDLSTYQISTISANGALTKFRSTTQGNTGTSISTSPGNLYRFNIVNTDTGIIYVKFYDKASAATSADTPFLTITVPAGVGSAVAEDYIIPDNFLLGLSIRCVTGVADNANTAPTNKPLIAIRYR